MDSYSRKIAGWSFSDSLASNLVEDAIKTALNRTKKWSKDLLFQSDRGVQYTSKSNRILLSESSITASMSRKGSCYDNSKSESFFSTLKNKLVHRCEYKTKREAKISIFEWIEVFYNNKRVHSALGYKSLVDFEQINN